MEINVWARKTVLVVSTVLTLSSSLTATPRRISPGSSPNAQEAAVASTSTYKTGQESLENTLTIKRRTTAMGESRLGVMAYEGKVLCYTLENEGVKIPAGRYRGELRWSERFGETVPYIHVPSRTGIEVHRGNCPGESGGCVLVGTSIDGVCLGNSRSALKHVVEVLPSEFTVIVE